MSFIPDFLKPKKTYIDNHISTHDIYKNDKWKIYVQCHGSANFFNFYSVYVKIKETGNKADITSAECIKDMSDVFTYEDTAKTFTELTIEKLPELASEKENIIKAILENAIIDELRSYDGAARSDGFLHFYNRH